MKGLSLTRRKSFEAALPEEVPLEVDAIYRAYAQRVAGWAARLGGPRLDVEDVVQEVFLTVIRKLPDFRGEGRVTTWLFRITENVVRHRRRKERFRRWLGGTADEVAGDVVSGRPTPVEELERRQATALVYRALDALPEKDRTVLILFELDELPGEAVAELCGLKLQTLWVRLHRARAKFLVRLEQLDGERAPTRRTLSETTA